MNSNKTLFISDLDGTLLAPDATVSEYTKEMLKKFTAEGFGFSIATARTPYTVNHILKDVPVSIPAALMNGAVIYDLKEHHFVDYHVIPEESYKMIADVLKKHNISGFLYEVVNDELKVYYENLDSYFRKEFHDERVIKFNKPFTHIPDFRNANVENPVYFSIIGTYDELYPATIDLKNIPYVDFTFYKDNYFKDGWFLEVFSEHASKFNAVKTLRERYGFKEVIGFGDNLNDLPLRRACDKFYAVANAAEELKKISDGIILSNKDNGVAKKLMEYSKAS